MLNTDSLPMVKVCFVNELAKILYVVAPSYATEHAAGIDLRACFNSLTLTIDAGQRELVPSGIAIEPISGYNMAGFVYARSGLGAKNGITIAQGVGVIDSDYRGEIMLMLLNTGETAYTIKQGERVAQLVFQPIIRPHIQICTELEASKRGAGGFGHTGKD